MVDADSNSEIYEFPVSPVQAAFWMLDQMAPENPAYNIPVVIRVLGPVHVDALTRAVTELVQRHEILRTRYVISDEKLVQRISSGSEICLYRRSFEDAGERANQLLQEFIEKTVRERFDLARGDIVRAGLLEESKNNNVFYLIIHHIAVDHSAVLQLMQELQELYDAFSAARTPEIVVQELQYVDYVMWSKQQQDNLSSKIDAWRERLDPFSGMLFLPVERPRQNIPSGNGAEFRFGFTKDLSEKIKYFSQSQKISIFQTLFAAFVALLSRFSGQKDVIVGTPFTKRGDLEELQQVVGNFINTLPIAVMVDGDANFYELCAAVKEALLFGFEHQDVPFELIVNSCVKNRNPGSNPIFQTGFVFQEPPPTLSLSGLECTSVECHNGGAMYEMHLWMWETLDQVSGVICYDTDLYSEQSIAQLVGSFETLAASLLINPEKEIDRVELLSAAEKVKLDQWNKTLAPMPAGSSLGALIAATAEKFPDKIAVISDGDRLSYTELEQRATYLSHYLRLNGVNAGDLVGICLHRSVHLLVGLLGILKAGAAYVPLDPDYPDDRLLYMLKQSGVKVLVTESALVHGLPDYPCQLMCIDTEWDVIATTTAQSIVSPGMDSLMYVIFTSGSTGLPKAVQVRHGSALNLLCSMAQCPGLKSTDTLLAVTTLSFDISVLELFLPLLVGASVVVASRTEAADGQELANLLQRYRVTVMQATPSTWRMLIGAGWQGDRHFKVLCGGEAFPQDLAADLLMRAGDVWNMYGPTETTVWSTCYRIENAIAPILIGKPIGNTQCYVVNSALQLQPIGVAGELYIGGAGVTAGYLGRDDLTSERFVQDVFQPQNLDAKLYRTGDMVRLGVDGNLDYLNRTDNQVKVRGFRIELGEIEQTLLKLDAIASCVVGVSEYGEGDKRLVGYVQFHPGQHLTSSEVRRYLRVQLPEYMVLQHLVELDTIPLTANGKIDRKALPDPSRLFTQEKIFIAPTTNVETALSEIWTKIIGVEKVSVDSNFFELGGHSMLALEVRSQIERVFGVKLNAQDILLDSLEQLAVKLESLMKMGIPDAVIETAGAQSGFLSSLINRFKGG